MDGLRIKTITTRSGEVLDLSEVGVLCIVGGNNVGKSQFLRDVDALTGGQGRAGGVMVGSVEVDLEFASGDPSSWIETHGVSTIHPLEGQLWSARNSRTGQAYRLETIRRWMDQPTAFRRELSDWFVRVLDYGSRANLATSGLGIPGMAQNGGPIFEMWRDGLKEQRFSEACERAFGFPLTLDRTSGQVLLRVGSPGMPSPPLQRPTSEYADAVAALPALADQGDGVKNFLGVLLHFMSDSATVTILDEPEAFLHPAQVRALGRHVGEQVSSGERQVLVATHDRDFVLGLLEADASVMFLRVSREGNANSFAVLSPADVRGIWDKPVLRYSNVLQGLFHRVVVVCEGDPDCRWYSAVLDSLMATLGGSSEEALFVPAGGCDQVPLLVEALGALDVDSYAVLDFDVLLDPVFVKRLATSRGIDSERLVKLAQALSSQLGTAELRKRAKSTGTRGLPAGDCAAMATEMIDLFRTARVLVVHVGELESFDNTVGGHGSVWVSGALTNDRHRTCADALSLLKPVADQLLGNRPEPEQ